MTTKGSSIHWFRKCLRVHDNPALIDAVKNNKHAYPIFILDPHFANPERVGIIRYNFLLESLIDIDKTLRSLGSRLYIIKGNPEIEIPLLFQKWNIDTLSFEGNNLRIYLYLVLYKLLYIFF